VSGCESMVCNSQGWFRQQSSVTVSVRVECIHSTMLTASPVIEALGK
jgi:hypothetical protein